jgi:hypothetical protein
MEGKFTVYFDDPFWIGVCERQDEDGYSVARVVFGGEPSDAALYQFILKNYRQFIFSRPSKDEKAESKPLNFKRAQREARRVQQNAGIGTKAQEALKAALAQNKQERQEYSKVQREAESEQRFLQRQQKKREKHRGH